MSISFSFEEWDYIENHKNLYKDVMVEMSQPLSPIQAPEYRKLDDSSDSIVSKDKELEELCMRSTPEADHSPACTDGSRSSHLPEESLTVTCPSGDTVEGDITSLLELREDYKGNSSMDSPKHDMETRLYNSTCDPCQGQTSQDEYVAFDTADTSWECLQIKKEINYCDDMVTRYSADEDHGPDISDKKHDQFQHCRSGLLSEYEHIIHQTTHPEVNNGGDQLSKCFGLVKRQRISNPCHKWFTTRTHLMAHHQAHEGDKPYCCHQCGKCFAKSSYLVTHQQTHTGEKPHSCPDCGKSFAKRTNLVSHVRVHTREKPFVCPLCGKCFTRRSNMMTHQRTHTGEKPFPCPACGKCFAQRSHLLTHHRTHSGEKPYSCTACGKCFTKRSYLEVHLRTHEIHKSSVP